MEREMILRTLKDGGGNKVKAAAILGVTVRTIRNKLNEYGQ
jgi:DNA-binding NtrC family response regulator